MISCLLHWMKSYNEGRDYKDQIKHFGFMVSFTARDGDYAQSPEPALVDPGKRGKPKGKYPPKPSAPFERDPAKAASSAFDRVTGEPVDQSMLKTYAESLANYHLHPEDKFEGGDYYDSGETRRRHVKAETISLIGKEANNVGEGGEVNPTSDGVGVFSLSEGETNQNIPK
jgi:hypothetical protein